MNMNGTSNVQTVTTSDAIVATGKAVLTGVNYATTSGDETITIYDNTSAAGKIIFKFIFSETGTDSKSYYTMFPAGGIQCQIGIYVDVTTGARYSVAWR